MSDVARNRNRNRYLRACVLAMLGLFVLLRFVACDPTNDAANGEGTSGVELGGGAATFTIEGNATGAISPGMMIPLDLEFTNLHDVAMSVINLTATVQGVSAPRANETNPCTVSDFAVNQASRSLDITVTGDATSTLSSLDLPRHMWPQLRMLDSSLNQDGCKGASLTLDYTANGTLAE